MRDQADESKSQQQSICICYSKAHTGTEKMLLLFHYATVAERGRLLGAVPPKEPHPRTQKSRHMVKLSLNGEVHKAVSCFRTPSWHPVVLYAVWNTATIILTTRWWKSQTAVLSHLLHILNILNSVCVCVCSLVANPCVKMMSHATLTTVSKYQAWHCHLGICWVITGKKLYWLGHNIAKPRPNRVKQQTSCFVVFGQVVYITQIIAVR